MLAFMFPGQGSQFRGMGEALFDEVDEFLSAEPEIDSLLGYSLRQMCLENPNNKLKQTQYTQPCLYVVNALHYYQARAKGVKPEVLAGHSLGEYNALLVAETFDFLTGLRMVIKRGELMAAAKNGAMAAVIGLEDKTVKSVLRDSGVANIDIANYNAPGQVVISGQSEAIQSCAAIFESAGAANYIPLPVSAAFHSRHMVDAARAFQTFLVDFTFNSLKLPVIANVTGRPYPAGDPTLTVRAFLVRQISQSVKWTQSIRYLLDLNVSEFTEIGPGKVLTKLVDKIKSAEVGAVELA